MATGPTIRMATSADDMEAVRCLFREYAASLDFDLCFRVRLWDQDALIGELPAHYDKLDESLRADLPLKRIWTLAVQENGGLAAALK